MSDLQEFLDRELGELIELNEEDDFFVDLGLKLKKIRCEKNISQVELEKKTGISQSNICKIEKGKANITLKQLKKYVDGINAKLVMEVK